MEDEIEVVEQPETSTEDFDDDFFGEIDNQVIQENQEETPTEEESSTPNENQEEGEKEIDFKPFLDYLSKNAKYNKESVNVDNIEDVINNFQKGLNYDKLQSKYNDLSNGKALSFISKKANELGISVDEYMDQVEAYEKEQEKAKDEEYLNQLKEYGLPDEIANEILATSQVRKEMQQKINELEKEKQTREEQNKKDEEFNEFIKEFPNVKAEDIPKDVFLNANEKHITLTQAYKDYLLAETQKELAIYKQNESNASKAIGSTQNYGSIKQEPSDPFLEGFFS